MISSFVDRYYSDIVMRREVRLDYLEGFLSDLSFIISFIQYFQTILSADIGGTNTRFILHELILTDELIGHSFKTNHQYERILIHTFIFN